LLRKCEGENLIPRGVDTSDSAVIRVGPGANISSEEQPLQFDNRV
jgi:hypothetical protein